MHHRVKLQSNIRGRRACRSDKISLRHNKDNTRESHTRSRYIPKRLSAIDYNHNTHKTVKNSQDTHSRPSHSLLLWPNVLSPQQNKRDWLSTAHMCWPRDSGGRSMNELKGGGGEGEGGGVGGGNTPGGNTSPSRLGAEKPDAT